MGKRLPKLAALTCAIAALLPAGCGRPDGSTLTVATSWPLTERQRVEAQLLREKGRRIRWILLAPGDDVARLANRRFGPDVILGVSPSALASLARAGVVDANGTARRSSPDTAGDLGQVDLSKQSPGAGNWAERYARLVREGDRLVQPGPGTDRPVESVVALRSARDVKLARAFVEGVASEFPGHAPNEPDPEADALFADLLRSTLVDAEDELNAARAALTKAGHPEKADRWLGQPPPWPPASVEALLGDDSSPMEMMNALASQVAPDAGVRSWLVRSWLAPPRRVDDRLLAELAAASDGKLAREPRFRAWLRGEWRAWARQRYRRVARLAAEGGAS